MKRLLVVLSLLALSACTWPTEDVITDPGGNCRVGFCYIRSAYTCCPNGYLNYAGAGYGCYSTRQSCLNASGGKCWYETSCYP